MIYVKSPREIELMRQVCVLAAAARKLALDMAEPGVRTIEIDKAVHEFLTKSGAAPSFLNYNGYPASTCISLNEEVIHGIPGRKKIRRGDLVSIDIGAYIGGFHGDCAASIVIGEGEEAARLVKVTQQSFFEGVKYARAGQRVSDISHAIQTYCEKHGYGVVRDYVGHGVGASLHEEPPIPNYGSPGRGSRLQAGMTLAIEPMINAGLPDIKVLRDKWTVVTKDGSLSAHYENTVLVTDGEPEILTLPGGMQSW